MRSCRFHECRRSLIGKMGLFGMALSYLTFSVLHFFQFVLAIVVCGLYGVDLHRASSAGVRADGKWYVLTLSRQIWSCFRNASPLTRQDRQVYAEVVGGLSALTAALYFIPFIVRFEGRVGLECHSVHSLDCPVWDFRQRM